MRINGFPADSLVSLPDATSFSSLPDATSFLQALASAFWDLVARHSFDNQILENID